MQSDTCKHSALATRLIELAGGNRWAFRSWAAREQSHGLFQYPAMMVPQMQRELMAVLAEDSRAISVYDPFVGSGTTMAEAMLQGMDFLGSDVNPLAILLCRAKAGPFFTRGLLAAGDRVCLAARRSRARSVAIGWQGWEKWFRRDVAVDLSRLHRA